MWTNLFSKNSKNHSCVRHVATEICCNAPRLIYKGCGIYTP